MNKCALAFFLLLPIIVNASGSSLSFTPPPSDISVVFLGNIFGIVDGILHGTGSQIMGNMFGVFNAAVLALGGIIIMYTLLVSTMNTAHEGQMLGQKWSSMWVPMRATLGLALLIPKASGYCIMQIFVMWVVVQGVGAADKVWAAALGYLNQGGVIVQAQQNPMQTYLGGNTDIPQGASVILSGQVCMAGLQTILANARQGYLNRANQQSGPCSGTPSAMMNDFCNTPVPDFLQTVNVVTVQQQSTATGPYSVPMPNFENSSPYAVLNGLCGTISWQAYTAANNLANNNSGNSLTSTDAQTAQMSRAVAIQQMYTDLSIVAQLMVNNDPALNPVKSSQATSGSLGSLGSSSIFDGSGNDNPSMAPAYPGLAQQQFGVPYTASGAACKSVSVSSQVTDKSTPQDLANQCISWGSDAASDKTTPLFGGTEFIGAQADYNGIMLPTLTLVSQAQAQATQSQQALANQSFFNNAINQGWLLAGSYFINLASINQANSNGDNSYNGTAQLVDTSSGLGNSQFSTDSLSKAFSTQSCGALCTWLNQDVTQLKQLLGLINGSGLMANPLPAPAFKNTAITAISGIGSSTTFGFINNSQMVTFASQPGTTAPQFAMKINFSLTPMPFALPPIDFPCGGIKFMWTTFCVGQLLGEIFYNNILLNLFNFLIAMMVDIINNFVMAILTVPLKGMAQIFTYGVSFIQKPGVNPVIALANMGVNYINFSNDIWIYAVGLTAIPVLNVIFIPLIALIAPLLFAWLGTMVAIGFITAYYIPFLPYMIFTFGSIAWLMAVIEAMVAAPIVALGITHPEGEGPFGKGEQAIMILMNIFLRPAMMIIGYIAAIVLSYVSVWIINAGFANVVSFIQGDPNGSMFTFTNIAGDLWNSSPSATNQQAGNIDTNNGYSSWAGVYGFFFSVLIYTTMYLIVVQRAFTLITMLPDKVLRWIGGQPESIGSEASQWGDEAKKQVEGGAKDTYSAQGQRDKALTGYVEKGISYASDGGGTMTSVGGSSGSPLGG